MELENLQNIYDESFFDESYKNYTYEVAKTILSIVFKYYKPNSVIDIGCAIGAWLKASLELGVKDIMGVDCNNIPEAELLVPRKYIQIDNLETHENINNKKYDMVISLEVAEHLDYSVSEHFIDTLVSYGNIILFSAAIPYQEGTNHINCQEPQFWFELFKKHNYICFDFRDKLMNIESNLPPHSPQNILLYVHNDLANIFDKYFYITKKPAFFYHPYYVNAIIRDYEKDKHNYMLLEEEHKHNYMLLEEEHKHNYMLLEEEYKCRNTLLINYNWFNLLTIFNINFFSISNNNEYIRITLICFKITFKIVNENTINKIAWWIPVKKWRDNFKNKFKVRSDYN